MKGEGKREFGWMVKEGRMVREIVKERRIKWTICYDWGSRNMSVLG